MKPQRLPAGLQRVIVFVLLLLQSKLQVRYPKCWVSHLKLNPMQSICFQLIINILSSR